MIYIVLSILSSTLILIAFRLFTKFEVDTLSGIVLNYFTAAALGFIYQPFSLSLEQIQHWNYIPVFLGVMFILMFFIMARSTQTSGVTVTGIAVKMSLIIPVIAGVVLYDEKLDALDLWGIILAVIAVVMSVYKGKTKKKIGPIGLLLPLFLFAGSGLVDSGIKWAQHSILSDGDLVPFTSAVFLFSGSYGMIILIIRNIRQKRKLHWRDAIGGIGLGIPNFGSIYFLLMALSLPNWPSSQIFPLNHVGIVLASAFTGILLFGEKLNRINQIGLVAAILAIFIISYY